MAGIWGRVRGWFGGTGDTGAAVSAMQGAMSGQRRITAGQVTVTGEGPGGPVSVSLRTLPAPAGASPVVDLSAPVTVTRAARRERRGQRSYDGASTGRNAGSWYAPSTNANTEVARGLPTLRNRSSDLIRNNGHAANAIEILVSNMIGEGIKPRSNTGDRALDRKVNALHEAWAKVVDPLHGLDLYGVQALAWRSMLERGDSLIRARLRSLDDGLPVPLQLELLEGDLLDLQRNEQFETGARIVSGIEISPIGRRSAYWLLPFHPGESLGWGFGGPSVSGWTSRPVPADRVVHLYRPLRIGQMRGTPMLSPVVSDIRDLDDYTMAEGVRKKAEACLVAFVLGASPSSDLSEGLAPVVEDADGNPIETFEPGMVVRVKDGQDVRVHSPQPSPDFAGYKDSQLREIAAGVNVTFEQLSGNLANVSFASYRVGRVEFFRKIRQLHAQIVIQKLCNPIWGWFIDAAVAAGLLPYRKEGYPVTWSEPRFESIERDRDAAADKAEVRNGTRSLYDVIASQGKDPETVLEAIAEAFKKIDELGLVLDSDPRRVGAVGAGSAAGGGPAAGPAQPANTGDKPDPIDGTTPPV